MKDLRQLIWLVGIIGLIIIVYDYTGGFLCFVIEFVLVCFFIDKIDEL